MKSNHSLTHYRRYLVLFSLIAGCSLFASFGWAAGGGHGGHSDIEFPYTLEHYEPIEAAKAAELGRELGLIETLKVRAAEDPFNIVATLIFVCAILHTFMAAKFMKMAHDYEHEHKEKTKGIDRNYVQGKEPVSFKATLFHFLGEIEAIFGIWLLPLIVSIMVMKPGWLYVEHYINTRNYVEPMFVVIIMTIASTRPVIKLAENALRFFAKFGKESPAAWWLSILTIAPLLGSFITEPAAMTIAALLLGQQFYALKPNAKFCYATLGLLFVNISVGGTLTHFAAPPVLMVATVFEYDLPYMLMNFGWRATLGIIIANTIYFFVFRKNFAQLKQNAQELATRGEGPLAAKGSEEPVPVWVIVVHMFFLGWTVFTLHTPALFIGGFLFFIAFTMATDHHQYQISLKGPMLVGFFLAGLVTHGGFQGWWIAPVLSSLSEIPLFIGSVVLTGFNDNAAITFLASQVPVFLDAKELQYAVVAGAVTGGGLTVIANAPNPAGQSILSKYFKNGVSPMGLLIGSLIPTLIMSVCFMVIPH